MSITNPIDPNILPSGPIGPDSTDGPSFVPLLTDNTTITDSFGPSDTSSSSSSSSLILSADEINLPFPDLTLSQFMKTVSNAIGELRETIFATEDQNNLTLRNMHLNGFLVASNLTSIFNNLMNISHSETLIYNAQSSQIAAINSAIQTYNTNISATMPSPNSDNQQTNAINVAIAQYNAGNLSLADFTIAVDSYNAYASSRNLTIAPFVAALNSAIAAYNLEVSVINAQIEEVNILRLGVGLDPLPLEELLTPVTLLPLVTIPPTLPVPSLPSRTSVPTLPNPNAPQTSHSLISTIFSPQFDAQLPPVISFQNFLEIVQSYREFVQFFLESRVKIQPNGYVEPLPAVFFNSAAGVSTVSGVGLGSLAIGLDTRGMEKLLGNAIYTSSALQFGLPLPARLLETLKLFSLKSLSVGALLATIPATRIVANKLPYIDITRSASAVFLGYTYSTQISNSLAADDNLLTIQGFARSDFPGFNDARLKQLSGALNAGLNLSLLNFGLFQLSQSLGIPGLASQLVGLPLSEGSTVGDVFQNPLSIANLKFNLAKQLVSTNVSNPDNADSIANSSINNVIAQREIKSAQDLNAALLQEFRNQGIANQNAIALAQGAADFITAESLGLYLLDTRINRDILNRQILSDRLKNEGINSLVADTVISKILSVQTNSLRSLRDQIAEELKSSYGNALLAATKAVIGDQTINAPPLLSPSELSDQIAGKVVALLSPVLSTFEAQNVANQINLSLFGPTVGNEINADESRRPNSIKNQLIAQMEHLHKLRNEEINSAIQELFRGFSKPNFDLYAFNLRIMDPANTFLLSMWTGAMYKGQGDFPSNYQKTLDVII